jgi:hypothetical protein
MYRKNFRTNEMIAPRELSRDAGFLLKRSFASTLLSVMTTGIVSLSITMLYGCNGNPTSGGGENFLDDTFGESDSTTGRIEITAPEELQVGSTGEFVAIVYDANNAPVRDISVTCDSEDGLAIIEPSRGFGLTSQRGGMSGVLGCEAPGSLRFGCRLPVGTDKRAFVTVRCQGTVPAGFTGFQGAAGGGLGGGVVNGNASDPDNFRVTGISVLNVAAKATSSIDITRNTCGATTSSAEDNTPEPYGDDSVEFTVVNTSPFLVRFNRMRYVVEDATGNGRDYRSPFLAISGDAVSAASNATVKVSSLFMDATVPNKSFANGSTRPSTGFKNVTFTVFGESESGEEVSTSGSVTLSFDDFQNCIVP